MTQGHDAKMAEKILGQQPAPSRPSLQSQHSNSVPSTPYQQPRELGRFHSRSPSPHRGLSNQSPRSVVSEAPAGQTGSQRSAPVVCKFETGAEIRKRRIPYVEGGNEELGPPKKEPKKTLGPDEREKLSGDMRELYDRLLPTAESEERRGQLVKKLERILNEEWPGNDIRVNVFGSSGNLLSSSDSDVDICITTPFKKLESMHSIAMLLHKRTLENHGYAPEERFMESIGADTYSDGMEKVVCRASAKVPIVKCWDPELKLAADLNVNNPLALENTRMIKTYVQLDDRVRPLAKIIKYWTKRRILNDAAFGGTISSYTWICMIISFLQRRESPILPSLQNVPDRRGTCESGEKSHFADDVEKLKGYGDANKETLAELLFCFFRHYGYEFEYSRFVVSVKEGRLVSRKEKGWNPDNYADKEARNRLCVEEPFTTNRNLGNSADDYAWHGIHGEIRRAFALLADGGQLEMCCEQYEFPPEEKPIFQRPAPKPKPTLTRSASQSGRPNHEPGSGRSRKAGNRNQSAQRAGNRRASSGASFSNQRVPLGFQSPQGGSVMDYFAAKGDLHNQLYQQYQFLQAQQDVLRSQLVAQQQAQSQSQGRGSDMSGSPHHRPFQNGLPSPRFLDNPPQTAPLLPGYLYHYPARYPPPSPMSQARTREGGTSTNPSSPSLVAAVPALRRQVHRASVTDGSSSSIRSQSQPGRSLPHPLTLQQQAHPGYDVSGAIGGQYQNVRSSSQIYPQNQPAMPYHLPFSPPTAGYPATSQSAETAMPKEYVGYYVGQSPSLGPQFATANQMPMPPMMLRDPPPQRQRRVTPDLMPPLPNGKHSSRSPSPLGHLRSYSTAGDLSSSHQVLQSPSTYAIPAVPPVPPVPALTELAAASALRAEPDLGGPLIVNGSNPVPVQTQPERMNGIARTSASPSTNESSTNGLDNDLSKIVSLPLRSLDPAPVLEQKASTERPHSPTRISPSPNFRPGQKLNLASNGTSPNLNGTAEHFQDTTSVVAPLLSPVAEMRTPSPTRANAFEKDSPQANGLVRTAQLANANANADAKQAENEQSMSAMMAPKHERKGSAPNPTTTTSKAAKSPTIPTPTSANQNQNPWQQATRKGHKKSKSTAGGPKSPSAAAAPVGGYSYGQALPANEAERKGG